MSSLADQISKLTNPTPVFEDPEDIADETGAKLLSGDVDDDNDVEYGPSTLRSRAAVLHDDTDIRYSGKRISRRSLAEHSGSEEDSDDDDMDTESGEVIRSSDDFIQSEEEEDEQLEGFKEKMKFQDTSQKDISFDEEEEDDESSDDDEDDDDDSSDKDEQEEENEEELQQFTKVNVEEEIQKGKAVKTQLNIWDSMLECRIKLQKAVIIVNQLPQCDTHNDFINTAGTGYSKGLLESGMFLQKLLEQLVQLQTDLFAQNQDTKHLVQEGGLTVKPAPPDDDEEITSESDTEEKIDQSQPSTQPLKRKMKMSQYPEFISKRHKDFSHFRNTTIQKWYDKTRMSSGKVAKGFSGFEQSAVKQIEQIMTDKERLIKRTQLRRSAYQVLGQLVTDDSGTGDHEQESSTRDQSKDYDVEIFDDDDFYHQQLRELIERKSADVNDPVALSRQWLEIQKLRRKTKKNVDTKASKGRKIRYDVHKKLVNFMAPYDQHRWTNEAKTELYKSLFGKNASARDAQADR